MELERFKELCFLYFLGQIFPEDYKEFRYALNSGAEEYRKAYFDINKIYLSLPLAAEQVSPSPNVKKNILNLIETKPGEKKASIFDKIAGIFLLNKPAMALAFSVLLIAVIIILSFSIGNLNEELTVKENRIVQLRSEVEQKKELLNVLSSKKIEIVIMNGLDVNPAGYGKIIWDPDRKAAILQISNLPPTSENKDYQLWLIKDKPISAGVFNVNQTDGNFYKIDHLEEGNKKQINAFAVTLEPKGGVPQPTGEMYLLGSTEL